MLSMGMYIADRYEILEKIGAGGMSDVYKAKDHMLGRSVAVKILKSEFSEDMNFVTKFRTEAQSAAGLEHPNIVNIYDVGSENGMHFIVMEYVEGITLKTYIEKKGQLSFKETVSISIQVARGIEVAHSKHIIHRDIKPQNIIISTDGKVKVTDFGIARAASSNTISADVMGSVHYASPEQARNGFVDGKSDIYSLGIVMFEMVTGRVPFDGDTTVAVAIQHLQDAMPLPSDYARDLPISMEKIILKCTLKNPDRRYQTIGELLTDLRQSLATPDEDFVVMVSPDDNTKTKVMSAFNGAGQSIDKQLQEADAQEEMPDDEYVENEPDDEDEYYDDEDEDDEEGSLNPKLAKIVTIGGIVLAVILVIVIIYMVSSLIKSFKNPTTQRPTETTPSGTVSDLPSETMSETETASETETDSMTESGTDDSETESGEMVTMIDLVSKKYDVDEARTILEAMGLGLEVKAEKESPDHEVGQIMEQDIEKGKKVPKGTTIYVTVCKEVVNTFLMPKLVDLTEAEALKLLQDNKLKPDKDYAFDDSVESGIVISQDYPEGTTVKEGTTIKFIVSKGKEPKDLPNVVGMDKEAAKNEIINAGYNVDVIEDFSSTVAAGKVIRQDKDAGKQYKLGTKVTITVSKGKEEVSQALYSFRYEIKIPANANRLSYKLVDSNNKVIMSEGMDVPIEVKPGDTYVVEKKDMKADGGTFTYSLLEVKTEEVVNPETGETETKTTETKRPGKEESVSFTKQQ